MHPTRAGWEAGKKKSAWMMRVGWGHPNHKLKLQVDDLVA
jgi:hypothetical protein